MTEFRSWLTFHATHKGPRQSRAPRWMGNLQFWLYLNILQSPGMAHRILSQFSLVGITEEHLVFVEKLCNLTSKLWPIKTGSSKPNIPSGCRAEEMANVHKPTAGEITFGDLPTKFV